MGAAGTVNAGRALRGLSGVLAGGLVVLLAALGIAGYVAGQEGSPGPGTATLVWHALAVVVAVPAQAYADRRAGPRGAAAAGAVLVVAALLLTFQWFA